MLKDPILFFNLLDRIGRTGVVGIQIDGNHPTCVERDAYLRRLKASHLAEFDTLSHEEAIKLIFQPGFSTSESVSGISGRGIGMDAVKSKIKELGGTISVKTAGGRGSTNHQAL